MSYGTQWDLRDVRGSRKGDSHSVATGGAGGGSPWNCVWEDESRGHLRKAKFLLAPSHFLSSIILLGHQPYCDRSHPAKLPLTLGPSMCSDVSWPPTFSSSTFVGQQEVSCCGQSPVQCYTSQDIFYLDSGLLEVAALQPLSGQAWPHCVDMRIWPSPFPGFLEPVLNPDSLRHYVCCPQPALSRCVHHRGAI